MQYLNYFYPAIVGLGLMASYTDIRYRLIKNKHLLLALGYALIMYVFIYFMTDSPLDFVRLVVLNLLAACGLAYIFYLKDIWAAGDAKLFITLSVLAVSFKYSSLFLVPTLALFVNTALISFIFQLVKSLKNIVMNLRDIPASILNERLKKIPLSLAIVFTVTWIVWFSFSKVDFSHPLLALALTYASYFCLSRWMQRLKEQKRVLVLILVLGLALRLRVQPQFFMSIEKILAYLVTMLKYTILFSLIDFVLFFHHERKKDNHGSHRSDIPFAPFMFLGALAMESPLIVFTLRLLYAIKH